MSDNVLETVRATVQDFLAPEIRTHGVRLDNIDRRLDDMKKSLEQRSDDLKSSLEHRILDSKETLRAEMQALEARMDGRLLGIEKSDPQLDSTDVDRV